MGYFLKGLGLLFLTLILAFVVNTLIGNGLTAIGILVGFPGLYIIVRIEGNIEAKRREERLQKAKDKLKQYG